jgi:hypothetical protein
VLGQHGPAERRLTAQTMRGTIGVLAKTAADVQRADAVVAAWFAQQDG